MGSDGPVSDRIVSIIVPCRNEVRHLSSFLSCLAAQNYRGKLEVLIADGMSTDGTRAILAEWALRDRGIRIIDNPRRIVSTGLNLAIRAAHGDILIRMDAHTAYAHDYVSQCYAVLEETGADNAGGAARTEADGFMQRAIAAAYGSRFSTGGARFHDESYEGYVDTVPYGCWRRGTLERIGLFDEALERNQDDELNLRLTRMGGKIWQSRRIVSWYRPRSTLGGLFRQYWQYGFWKVAVIRKHKQPASWRHLAPGAFVVFVVLLACFEPLYATAVLGAYLTVLLGASVVTARRHGRSLFPVLPLVFATYHFAYGTGFLWGVFVRRR
jgi:succinoglycan biosynthesis protein ExoA